jgi:hypothetical protein
VVVRAADDEIAEVRSNLGLLKRSVLCITQFFRRINEAVVSLEMSEFGGKK